MEENKLTKKKRGNGGGKEEIKKMKRKEAEMIRKSFKTKEREDVKAKKKKD